MRGKRLWYRIMTFCGVAWSLFVVCGYAAHRLHLARVDARFHAGSLAGVVALVVGGWVILALIRPLAIRPLNWNSGAGRLLCASCFALVALAAIMMAIDMNGQTSTAEVSALVRSYWALFLVGSMIAAGGWWAILWIFRGLGNNRDPNCKSVLQLISYATPGNIISCLHGGLKIAGAVALSGIMYFLVYGILFAVAFGIMSLIKVVFKVAV